MPEPIKFESHYDRAVERLPMQFRDKNNIDAIMQTWQSVVQDVENDLCDVKEKTEFFMAEGDNLDRYGHWAGLTRRFGEPDLSYKDRIAAEIIARASDATPDSMRRVIEAVIGINTTDCIEYMHPGLHYANNVELSTGGIFLYGFAEPDAPRPIRGGEAELLLGACPITTGSVVMGIHQRLRAGENSLFIPSELLLVPDNLGVISPDSDSPLELLVTEPPVFEIVLSSGQFERFGENWEQGLLAEVSFVSDKMAVGDTNSTDTLDVEVTQGVEAFNVYTVGVENTRGVMLEVDIHYND